MDDLEEIANELAKAASSMTGHGQADWQILAQTRGVTSRWARRMASEFVAALMLNPITSPLMSGNRELRETNLSTWLESLLSGAPSRGFWAECALIGLMHTAAGVPAGLVVAGARHIEEVFLMECMGEFKPSEALRVHTAFCRVLATAVSVMTTSGEDISRDTLASLGIDPGQFHQQLRLTIQRRVRGERTKLPPIDWVSALAVGVDAIDEQHRQLFSLLNEFQKASSADSDEALLRETVNELVEYTKIHFAFEETLLAKHEYPDLEPHKLAHIQLAVQVSRYAESSKFGAGPLSSELYFFLRTWLNGHIRGTDRRYGAYLNARGVS